MSVVATAHKGCYLVVSDKPPFDDPRSLPSWCIGYDDELLEEYEDLDDIPDLTIDPEDGVLTILNPSAICRSYFVTVDNCAHIISAEGIDMLNDSSTGERMSFITFIALLKPMTCLCLCTLQPKAPIVAKKKSNKGKKGTKKLKSGITLSALESIKITSDIQDYVPTLNSSAPTKAVDVSSDNVFSLMSSKGTDPTTTIGYNVDMFPLKDTTSEGKNAWLCTQSQGGSLTHFAHPSTYYAVDFRCEIGTPLVAIFDGEVLEIRKESIVSGVHVSNLFSWNSIVIKKSQDDVYVEYVHVHHDGIACVVGDHVKKGDVIGLSGAAGFCPEPHLHLQIQRSRANDAPSVPITLHGCPIVAGQSYPSYLTP